MLRNKDKLTIADVEFESGRGEVCSQQYSGGRMLDRKTRKSLQDTKTFQSHKQLTRI